MNRTGRRVSREMHLLIVTMVIAGAVLLLLARFRFPDAPASAMDVTQPLERLAARASSEELAGRVARFERAMAGSLLVLRLEQAGTPPSLRFADLHAHPPPPSGVEHVPALRTDAATALAVVPPDMEIRGVVGQPGGATLAAVDPVRHVARVRLPAGEPPAPVRQLALSNLQTPTYVIAVEGTRAGIAMRPVFIARADRYQSPQWPRPLLPLGGTALAPGALLFTLDGELLGCAVVDGGMSAIASAADLVEAAGRARLGVREPVDPGLTVQPLTAPVAAATGATTGVVIAAVEPRGPAAGVLEPGDVVVAMDGAPVPAPAELLLDLGTRLATGAVRIAFVRGQQTHEAELRLPGATAAGGPWRLERVRGIGARVAALEGASPLALAGVAPGDVIVRAGDIAAPTPAQVDALLRQTDSGRAPLLVVRRGGSQYVTAVRVEDRDGGARR